jgi:hypothetical protein
MNRLRAVAWWIVPSLVCLAIQWPALTAWFRADDFAWMGLAHRDLLTALFHPFAQGTIRPLSERAFFLAGFGLFGMNPLPFRIVIFATQFANLALMAAIARRITGSAQAAFAAAMLWAVSDALVLPLGWVAVYNQVLCAFFLLLAFYAMLRGWSILEWIAFLLGFGAMELNVVYPALAAAYAPKRARRTIPMFAVSVAYVVLHWLAAHPPRTGDYAFHWTGAMLRTLVVYWSWTVGPVYGWTPFIAPAWFIPVLVALVTIALLTWAIPRRSYFGFAWFLITIAPVLPVRDHRMEYYVYIPAIGVCWLMGSAIADWWRSQRVAAIALILLYCAMIIPRTLAAARVNHAVTERVRNLVEGLAGAREQHPNQAILLDGVDPELFNNAVLDHPFRALGIDQVYLSPGSERIAPEAAEFVLSAGEVTKALDQQRLVVYDVRGPQLRNITTAYASRAIPAGPPHRIDAANPLDGYLLGPEWYGIDGDHRWMARRATFRIARGAKLILRGQSPDAPLPVTVTINDVPATAQIREKGSFELAFPVPAGPAGELKVAIEVAHTVRVGSDARDLGLAFGTFEVRD